MAKCGACGKFLARTDAAECTQCPSLYQRACVALPAEEQPESWACPECKKNMPRDNGADTPVKGQSSAASPANLVACPQSKELSACTQKKGQKNTVSSASGTGVCPQSKDHSGLPPPTNNQGISAQRKGPINNVSQAVSGSSQSKSQSSSAASNLSAPAQHKGAHLKDNENSTASSAPKVNVGLEIKLFREELQSIREEFRLLRGEIADMKSIFNNQSQRIDDLSLRVETIEKQLSENNVDDLKNRVATLESQVSQQQQSTDAGYLEATIQKLRQELNEKDQDMLCNDLDITNLPETPGESTVHLVTLVAVKLGVKLDVRDIVFAERMGAPRNEAAGDGESRERPRPIAVRLTRRALRDELIKNARVRRGVTTANLGLSETERRIYVNERLTRYNRMILNKAREAAHGAQWKFAWTKRGRIYVRRAQGEEAHWIRSEADVERVFRMAVIEIQNQ